MKITNQKNIEKQGVILLFLILINLVILAYAFLILRKNGWLTVVLAISFLIFVIRLSTLRFTEFENSGLVISVRKKSLLRTNSFVSPMLEFPVEILNTYYLKSRILYLNISKPNKTQGFKINLAFFSEEQKKRILASISKDQKNTDTV